VIGDDALLLGHISPLLPAGALPSPAVRLLQLQVEMAIDVLPQTALWANPSRMLASPLDYPDYLGLMLAIDPP
jgi:hypothetical protein